MARPAKSPDEKRLTGAGKRKPATPKSPRPAGTISAPRWLKRAARSIWTNLVPELLRLNLVAPSDADVVGRYCHDLADWIKASRILDKEGLTVMVPMTNSDHKMPRRHPAVQVCSDLHRRMIDFEDRFGISPLARYRLYAQAAAHPNAHGDLFGHAEAKAESGEAATVPASPIGLLQRSTAH